MIKCIINDKNKILCIMRMIKRSFLIGLCKSHNIKTLEKLIVLTVNEIL